MKCIVDQSDYSGEEDAPQTGYYQWVTFMFAIQVFFERLLQVAWSYCSATTGNDRLSVGYIHVRDPGID